jgi:hypothetical protein
VAATVSSEPQHPSFRLRQEHYGGQGRETTRLKHQRGNCGEVARRDCVIKLNLWQGLRPVQANRRHPVLMSIGQAKALWHGGF